MKRFIFKTFLLLLPVVFLALSAEILLRFIPNEYKYKKAYLDNHAGKIQLLILGSSETYFGIDPVYFSQNTFNACHVSQSLDLDFEIFNKYRDKFNDLKTIVLPISYHTLWRQLKSGEESWRIKNYAIYYGIKTESLTDHSELLNGKLGINLQRIYNYYLMKKDEISCSTLGWGTSFNSKNANDLEETGKETALRHTYKDLNSPKYEKLLLENREILDSLANICNKKNITILFLTTPIYRSYREAANKEQLSKMVETMDDFVSHHNNCKYINWFDNNDFIAEDFFNADHLNEKGAMKLSKKLAQYIDTQ